jgi:hypothetical protein
MEAAAFPTVTTTVVSAETVVTAVEYYSTMTVFVNPTTTTAPTS